MSKKTDKRTAGKWEYRLQAFKALASFAPIKTPATGTTLQYRERGAHVWRKLNIYDRAPNDPAFSKPENILAIIDQYQAQKKG